MEQLHVLWTSGDKEVALKMVFMYIFNAKKEGWWKNVNLIIWGPSSKLASEDAQIQNELLEIIHGGITVEACKACSDSYGVSNKLEKFGITVRYMGLPLTGYLKSNEKVITF